MKTTNKQTVRQLRNGVTYLKTVNAFSTMHTFCAPVDRASVLKGAVSIYGPRAVKSIAVISKRGFEANKRAGNLFSTGNGSVVLWRD